MKKIAAAIFAIFVVPSSAFAFFDFIKNAAPVSSPVQILGDSNINPLDQFTSTTTPVSAITQRTYGKAIKITGLPTGDCLSLDSNSIVTTSACSGGGGGTTFSTTSADYWKTQRNFFSTTSADYWGGTKGYLTAETDPVVKAISGIVKSNGATISAAANGTDYTLISAASCSAGNHVSAITAGGSVTCSADTGSGGTFADHWATSTLDSRFISPAGGLGTIVTLSTTTNATSTSFFSTTASTTNLFASTLGIGVNSIPSQSFQLNAGEAAFTGLTSQLSNPNGLLIFGGTNGGTVYARGDNSGGDDDLVLKAVSKVRIAPNLTDLMTLTSVGVGIGTSSPFTRLAVVGTTTLDNFNATSTTATSTIASSLIIGNASPASSTNALTFPVNSTGIALYNTADTATNYERGLLSWVSNVLTLQTKLAGSGTARNLDVIANDTNATVSLKTPSSTFKLPDGGGGVAFFEATRSHNFSGTSIFKIDGTLTHSSIGARANPTLEIAPTINQSGTAGYVGLQTIVTETALGTGVHNLIQAGTSTAQSLFVVDNQGTTTIAGRLGVATTTPQYRLNVQGTANTIANISTFDGATSNDPMFAIQDSVTPTKRLLMGITSDGNGQGVIQAANVGTTRTNLLLNPNGGNIGIGGTAPGSLLEITSNTLNASSVTNANLYALLKSTSGTNGLSIGLGFINSSAATTPGAAILYTRTGGSGVGDLSFYTKVTASDSVEPLERMKILSIGNVGIASSSPWGLLSVSSANNTISKPLFVIASSSAAVSTTTPFIVTNEGLVGVNTGAPTKNFDLTGTFRDVVADGTTAIIASSLNAQNAKAGLEFNYASGGTNTNISKIEGQLVATNIGTLLFSTADGGASAYVERMRINSTGVGIGSTTPWGKLSIGTATYDATKPMFAMASTTAGGTGDSFPFFISANGNALFGTSTTVATNAVTIQNLNNNTNTLNIYSSAGTSQWAFGNNGVLTGPNTGTISLAGNSSISAGSITATGSFISSAGSLATPSYNTSGSTGFFFPATPAGAIGFVSKGVQKGALLQNGNFGIGTTSPYAMLSVSTTTALTVPMAMFTSSIGGGASTTNFIIDQNGNVGINTANPQTRLDTLGTASSTDLFVARNATSTNATSTNFAATTICLTGDSCRTTWPSSGGSTVTASTTILSSNPISSTTALVAGQVITAFFTASVDSGTNRSMFVKPTGAATTTISGTSSCDPSTGTINCSLTWVGSYTAPSTNTYIFFIGPNSDTFTNFSSTIGTKGGFTLVKY